MSEESKALRILREERQRHADSVPLDLVEEVYRIEFRVQFDDARRDVLPRLKKAISDVLDAEDLKGSSNADAI